MNDDKITLDAAVAAASDDCGCAPSPSERRALWNGGALSRRGALGLGALSVVALSAFGISNGVASAYAASYPSWDDVQRAKANEAAAAAEVTRIEGLIQALTQKVAETQAAAEAAADEFYEAQQAFFAAVTEADTLQAKADEQSALADESARKAAQVAAQLYRNGGDDASLELFFAGSAANADQLLSRLGTMDKLLQYNQKIYDDAVAARNSAQALSDQAAVARDERDRLQKVAEEKMVAAQDAAAAAQAALDEQSANLANLQGQLAALKDTTAQTVAAYQVGVEEERKRKQAEEEERRRQQNTGGGGGGGGEQGNDGWFRPHGGGKSSGYGPRKSQCGPQGCSSSFHYGTDFANGCGAPIYAAHSGTVDWAGPNSGYGNFIRIQHGNGLGSGYGHIMQGGIQVRSGQWVEGGQVIAYAGNTGRSFGCHLHFELYVNGRPVNPVEFLASHGVSA